MENKEAMSLEINDFEDILPSEVDDSFNEFWSDILSDDGDALTLTDNFDELLVEEPDGVSPELLKQTREDSIRESLSFMSWANSCLRNRWLSVPTTHSDINNYIKVSGASKNFILYVSFRDKCKQSKNLNVDLMTYIRYLSFYRLNSLADALKSTPNNRDILSELDFYKRVSVCKEYSEIERIPCNNPQQKRMYLQDIAVMRDIWELDEDEKLPTAAMRAVEEYRKNLDAESFILPQLDYTDAENMLADLDVSKYAMPTGIKFIGSKIITTCECGNKVDATDIVTFNLINIDSSELSHTRLNDLVETCRDPRIERWFKELQKPDTVFSHPSNREMLFDLHEAGKTLPTGTFNVYRNYITTAYGCACKFSPNIVCECGKHLVLPAKLLRYLAAWHASHGEDIYRHYGENTIAPGFIRYRDEVLHDKLETYQRSIYTAGENEIKRAITNLGDSIDVDTLRRNSMARVGIEAGPELEAAEQKITVNRSTQVAFDHIKAREGKHTLLLSRYVENTLTPHKPVSKDVSNTKTSKGKVLPLDYWRTYNTSEDKLMSALVYVVNSLHLPFNTSPKYVLSEVFRHSQYVRKTILLQAWYTNIMCLYSVYQKYLDTDDKVRSADSTYGTWRIDDTDKYEILRTLTEFLKKYSEVSGMFTSEELSLFNDCTHVQSETVHKFMQILRTKHAVAYQDIRSPEYSNPVVVTTVGDIDTELIPYITDELPWRLWYKLALVRIIEAHNPSILAALATSSTASAKVNSGFSRLRKTIIESAKTGDTNNGDYFWSKIPQNIRGTESVVLNKNLQEVALLFVDVPLPLTNNLMALLLQSDNAEDSRLKVGNYIKTQLPMDILERCAIEDLSFDPARLEPDKVWLDAIEWLKLYAPEEFTLPRYIREMTLEVE